MAQPSKKITLTTKPLDDRRSNLFTQTAQQLQQQNRNTEEKPMYGTIYRMQPRQGQEHAVLEQLQCWEQERQPKVTGYIGGYVLQSASSSGDILGIVVFDSQANYIKNGDDPEQDQWYRQLRTLLKNEPEWNDGEITEIMGEPRGL
jgi:quinol monooxygenase YgiN